METIQYPKLVKSKQEHVCDLCGGTIEKSTNYYKAVYKYPEIYTWKNHVYCSDIAKKLKMYEVADEGLSYELFYEIIKEEYLSKFPNDSVIRTQNEKLKFVLQYHGLIQTNE